MPLTREYKSIFSAAPIAEGVSVAFEGDAEFVANHFVDAGGTQKGGVLLVDRLEAVTHFEDVVDRLDGFLHEDVLGGRLVLFDDRLQLLPYLSGPRAQIHVRNRRRVGKMTQELLRKACGRGRETL